MTQFLKFLSNILLLVGLVVLGFYAFNHFFPTKKTTDKKPTLAVQIHTSSQTQEGPETATVATQTETQTQPSKDFTQTLSLIDQVKNQAERAHNYLQQDDTLDETQKNELVSESKALISQADHLAKYIQKGPSEKEDIYEKTIERKSLTLGSKINTLLKTLAHETTEQEFEGNEPTSLAQSVEENNTLLQALSTSQNES